jgi:hypothetical protein
MGDQNNDNFNDETFGSGNPAPNAGLPSFFQNPGSSVLDELADWSLGERNQPNLGRHQDFDGRGEDYLASLSFQTGHSNNSSGPFSDLPVLPSGARAFDLNMNAIQDPPIGSQSFAPQSYASDVVYPIHPSMQILMTPPGALPPPQSMANLSTPGTGASWHSGYVSRMHRPEELLPVDFSHLSGPPRQPPVGGQAPRPRGPPHQNPVGRGHRGGQAPPNGQGRAGRGGGGRGPPQHSYTPQQQNFPPPPNLISMQSDAPIAPGLFPSLAPPTVGAPSHLSPPFGQIPIAPSLFPSNQSIPLALGFSPLPPPPPLHAQGGVYQFQPTNQPQPPSAPPRPSHFGSNLRSGEYMKASDVRSVALFFSFHVVLTESRLPLHLKSLSLWSSGLWYQNVFKQQKRKTPSTMTSTTFKYIYFSISILPPPPPPPPSHLPFPSSLPISAI